MSFFEKTVLGSSTDPAQVADVADGKLPINGEVRLRNEDGTVHADPIAGKLPISGEVYLTDSGGTPLNTTNSGLDVNIQDQHTDVLDYYLRRDVNALAFSAVQTLNSYDAVVAINPGVTVGNIIRIQEDNRLFQAMILNAAGTTLTLDTPLDFPFTSAATVAESSIDMNVDGSVTPVVFSLEPNFDYEWDVVRLMFSMTHSAAGDDSKFGSLSALTRGLVLRKVNSINHTIFNVKTNGDIRLRAYDLDYSDKAGAGLYGTSFRRTFGGQSSNGVVVRLDGSASESIEIVIQDDLTSLDSFRGILQGHIVE